ncbi:hypothetical protein BaRGS_00027204, partial [Batillaria attramentaria]
SIRRIFIYSGLIGPREELDPGKRHDGNTFWCEHAETAQPKGDYRPRDSTRFSNDVNAMDGPPHCGFNQLIDLGVAFLLSTALFLWSNDPYARAFQAWQKWMASSLLKRPEKQH